MTVKTFFLLLNPYHLSRTDAFYWRTEADADVTVVLRALVDCLRQHQAQSRESNGRTVRAEIRACLVLLVSKGDSFDSTSTSALDVHCRK
jgi:hypothetical protein